VVGDMGEEMEDKEDRINQLVKELTKDLKYT